MPMRSQRVPMRLSRLPLRSPRVSIRSIGASMKGNRVPMTFLGNKGLLRYPLVYLGGHFECQEDILGALLDCLGLIWGNLGWLWGHSEWLRGFSYSRLEWGQSDKKLTSKIFFTFQVSCNISALHWPILFKFWWNDNYIDFAKQWWKPHLSISNN